jgi:TolB-like protein
MHASAERCETPTETCLIVTELGRVLSSHTFRRANRMRELLEFVVKGTLGGISLTEREAARAVFGRGEDFDAGIDPEVRIHYGRLRRKLAEYYSTEGKGSKLQIDLPARKYEPVFLANSSSAIESNANAEAENRHASLSANMNSLAVLPFSNLTNDPSHDVFCYGLTEELIVALASTPGVNVVASSSAFLFKDKSVDVRIAGEQLGVTLIMEGSVRMEEERTRVTVKLVRVNDGIAIWSKSLDSNVEGVLVTEQTLAAEILDCLPLDQNV